ncbi:hypothetical protein BT96DRAFT_814613 [Gymnopus androsaceus JB14]|uniref:Uncharacterized protein n=1 Tax=Gymnopus androsaceus JB14 TaxID=1447944 RepID=A0A6A4I140_9AGAR|nr:hypothetical protein BT96DRAFT_814613 [Gymnopus androsaceus JB14]
MEWLYQCVKVSEALKNHRRGRHISLPCGYGFGGGRLMPGSYANTLHNTRLIQQALDSSDIQALATYADRRLRAFFPKLHALALNLDRQIVDVDNPQIKCAFKDCCYPACHLNLHNAATIIHADYWNLVFLMCAVVCMGHFDHTRSVHFIAWSLGLVFEFPSGSAMYIPSACVTHSNTPLAPHEHRSSMAFFVPAGLVQWYHNGFCSDKDFCEHASPKQLGDWKEYCANLWEVGLGLFQPAVAL